ncbi:MAG: hypothetical protein BKP49_06975 [Treponema sp. CETP13]|nr:MAG: hypothetical protein BKP49_06975 [Treponema sp. CETP13]
MQTRKFKIPAYMRCAFGNLREHKQKTIILGLMITIGVFIMVLGYGFLESSLRGLKDDFSKNYTGDIVITGNLPKNKEEGEVTLFGVQQSVSVGMPESIPAILHVDEVKKILNERDDIATMGTTISNSYIQMSLENLPEDWDEDEANERVSRVDLFLFSFAGDEGYYNTFNDQTLIEGTLPDPNIPSALVDERAKKTFEEYYQIPLNVGDKILLTAYGSNPRIREVTVCGFYTPADELTSMGSLLYLDPTTARGLADLTVGTLSTDEFTETADLSIASLDEDDLFGEIASDDSMFVESDSAIAEEGLTSDSLDNLLGDTTLRDKLNEVDDGAWQFFTIKLKNPEKADDVIKELNDIFLAKNLNVKAINWKDAAGRFSSTSDLLEALFTILIVILAIVVFIVIMNTLVVSILERTAEIGTMRALGARRPFVRKMFFTETISIAIVSSLIGILLALITSAIVNAIGITITDTTARMFLGGGHFRLLPQVGTTLTTVLIIIVGTLLANIYPVAVALRITPLKAMNENQ